MFKQTQIKTKGAKAASEYVDKTLEGNSNNT
jgi:hypothetical protein